MHDSNGTELVRGCRLKSKLFLNDKDATQIVYLGDDTFECPGSGRMFHDQESLLDSEWVVVWTPPKK